MKLQRLLSLTRQCIDNYEMIKDNDKIAIGISGGKDSLTLLYALSNLRRFYPVNFDLVGINVSLGYDNMDMTPVEELCQSLNVPFYQINTRIKDIVFNDHADTNPCSLCAKLRKGALNEQALKLNCNKIAYAHHKDDAVETFFMSMMFESRLSSFSPVTYLDETNLTVIRPLLYLHEADIIGFKNKYHLPVVKNSCPADGYTTREYTKQLLNSMHKDNPGVKDRIFHAMERSEIAGYKA